MLKHVETGDNRDVPHLYASVPPGIPLDPRSNTGCHAEKQPRPRDHHFASKFHDVHDI